MEAEDAKFTAQDLTSDALPGTVSTGSPTEETDGVVDMDGNSDSIKRVLDESPSLAGMTPRPKRYMANKRGRYYMMQVPGASLDDGLRRDSQ
ncbi:hypothetical protein IscW_ISCW005402 [Ixodes scapularis]|uniref:Uncharacterized protein n=1 Tax=Ixodes scapularis TaxID=6945 RepID=B7PML4_IXOSC|nr:hypothetical protein IscW_ISCW005402 [Ixodes scapularis]|eukprot:XP_002435012.1 hypothetical protein IscW_ISCW005402 [Ixodes scapularis]